MRRWGQPTSAPRGRSLAAALLGVTLGLQLVLPAGALGARLHTERGGVEPSGPSLVTNLETRGQEQPQLVRTIDLSDLESGKDIPKHLLFTFGYEQDAEARRTDNESAVWVILYQTNMSLAPLGTFFYSQLAEEMDGWMQAEVLGQGTEWSGFSTKHHLALERMKKMNPRDIVILSDFGDVVLNPGRGARGSSMKAFKDVYRDITSTAPPGSVVISAEAQCCVAALSYVMPGDLVSSGWRRQGRACNSGKPGCIGTSTPGTRPWESFMERLADERGHRGTKYPYLNAGLMAGRARDLIRIIEGLELEGDEDDQAVMTDLLYRNPASFVLDYDQRLFGNARWAMPDNRGCVFRWENQTGMFTQEDTGTSPLFLHTSGHYFSCLRKVASHLGWEPATRARSAGRPAAAPAAAAVLLPVAAALSWLLL